MTNYRITCHKDELCMFKYCVTCGAKMTEPEPDENDELYSECSECSIHLKIWAAGDDGLYEHAEFR